MAIITVCGSGKNRELIHAVCIALEKVGHTVLTPPLHNISQYVHNDIIDAEGELLLWKGATFAHLNRIRTAEVCVMINPKGYIGYGSTLELGYAVSLGKLIIAVQHDTELARESLFDFVLEADTVSDIVKKIDELLRGVKR